MLKPKGVAQCECDVWKDTCSYCFVTHRSKPRCLNCSGTINKGKCCDNQKPYIRPGWVDNTDIIVKHTKDEKDIIRGWQNKRLKILEDAAKSVGKIAFCRQCDICKKDFSTRGKYGLDICKTCLPEYLKSIEWVKSSEMKVTRNF